MVARQGWRVSRNTGNCLVVPADAVMDAAPQWHA
jgi:hypothetical protein